MKKLAFLLLMLLPFLSVGQTPLDNPRKPHYIGVTVFQPVMTASMKQFHNDDWILIPENNYSRKYFSMGFGIDYNYNLESGYFFSVRPSVSIRRVKEGNKEDSYCATCSELDSIHTNEKFTYEQQHYNLFIGYGYKVNYRKIEVKTSLELAFVYYSTGKSVYEYTMLSVFNNPPGITGLKQNYIADTRISSGTSMGLGGNVSFQYSLSKNFKIGFSIADYLLHTRFKNKTISTSTLDIFAERTYYGEPQDIQTHTVTKTETPENFRQTSFSRIVPQLVFGYSF